MEDATRRDLLAGAGTLTAALAGCTALADEGPTPTPEPLDRLRRTAVYRAEPTVLPLPTAVERVERPADADLLVLPAGTDADPERVVRWLTDGRLVALVGEDPQATFLDWTDSEAFAEAFRGYGESDPPPDLLVVGATEGALETYGSTWGGEHDQRDLLEGLERALESDAETPTR